MQTIVIGLVMMLVQFVAAVPWLLAVSRAWQTQAESGMRGRSAVRLGWAAVLGMGLGAALVAGVGLGLLLQTVKSRDMLNTLGMGYGSLLQLQLLVDLPVLLFGGMSWLWPKGAAVARAAFREGYRQPMFWLLVGFAFAMLLITPFVPYFTFGEDYIMVKEMGFDTIMVAATVFGVIAAAMSISEEIEGRTAVTLMSKPVSRRQFLLGKFAGIFLCSLVVILGLGWCFEHLLLFKRWLDKLDAVPLSPLFGGWVEWLEAPPDVRLFLRGSAGWVQLASEVLPGLAMTAALVMILVAVAVSLATRLPMIVNLVTCLIVFFLANLAPVLVLSTRPDDATKAGPVQKLLYFTAEAFNAVLPGLEMFRVRPTLVDETSISLGEYLPHVGAVLLYGTVFTAIVLLLGLVLFEDRDLS